MNYCFDNQETHGEYCITGVFKEFLFSDILKNITPTKIKLNHGNYCSILNTSTE